jgi:hypothetical protein
VEEDPELLFFIKNGHFEDDLLADQALPERLADNFRSQEYHQNDIVKMINQDVNKMTLRTDEEKESLKVIRPIYRMRQNLWNLSNF